MRKCQLLGIDTGGTFTDLVYFDGDVLSAHKVLSTPDAPERAILQGIQEMGLEGVPLNIIHGSTVATNALLEGKGAKTAYITNYGLGDVLTIGRQARRELYNLQPLPDPVPVARELCLETGGRLSSRAEVIEPLTDSELDSLTATIRDLGVDAVAINLLFSFLDDRFELAIERAIEAAMPEEIFVSRSSQVLAEARGYERGIATWINSNVGPVMRGYLQRLQDTLPSTGIQVMQSHGGTISVDQAGSHAVQLVLSGPAGGLMGARYIAKASGRDHLMSFDMGGTSTDVALLDGDIRLTTSGSIGHFPVAVPMVDIHTIGAGGGSIAHVDSGGLLQVGPESAGASPGPACYAHGGTRPTVTDANLVLGRLPTSATLGGTMSLDIGAARRVIQTLADALGYTLEQAAEGVIRLANERMAQALRVISVQKGLNPADYTLVSFGGAGGLHVCELAESLNVREALVPVHAGVLSALGMLVAPQSRQLSLTVSGELSEFTDDEIYTRLDDLASKGATELQDEGVESVERDSSLDLRYVGQSSTLSIPWSSITQCTREFHAMHKAQFGHELDIAVELVNLRVGLSGMTSPPELPGLASGEDCAPLQHLSVMGISEPVAVYSRESLRSGQGFAGPSLVVESVSTVLVLPGWSCEVDTIGNLLLTRTTGGVQFKNKTLSGRSESLT